MNRANYIFIDFENVQKIDLSVIESKAVSITLLLGSQQTKLAASLVEKLLKSAAAVQLVRLTSAGRNALDFTLAYYVGRAVVADPTGFFHIVSKDAGYDPLIEHLRSKHIHAYRHNDCATLTFTGPVKVPTPRPPTAAPKLKSPSKPKVQPSIMDEREARVLEHLRKSSTKRPKSKQKLIRYLVAYLGHKFGDTEAWDIIEYLSQAGHLVIDEKGSVTYHLEPK